jgi:DNA transformation protein
MARPTAARTRKTSLRVSRAFQAYVLDQLEDVGGVMPRAMFGGVGLYCRGVFFGILARDVLYLKVDDRTRSRFETAGSHPFKPYPRRPTTMQYYSVPAEVLECAPELAIWARLAVDAAARPTKKATGAAAKGAKTSRLGRIRWQAV